MTLQKDKVAGKRYLQCMFQTYFLFQDGQFIWPDGSPLIDFSDWYVTALPRYEASTCTMNSLINRHWLGLYNLPSNPLVAHLMTEHPLHPLSAEQCVGYIATATEKTWLSVPCDQPLPTVVMCHQVAPEQKQLVSKQKHIHWGNTTCPYGWLTWEANCILYTQDHQKTTTCRQVDNEFVKVEQTFIELIEFGYDSVLYDDIHLIFIMLST